MIVPQDEFMLQTMLGVSTIPTDIADEYLKRIRYLHRATSGGPMGAGMLIDVLRFLGYEPASGVKTPEGQTDWRSVKIGTRVNVRRAGRWTLSTAVCRFAGFVDAGSLAVELPGGHVDEFMRHDVRIAISDMPVELDAASFEHKEGLQDVRLEQNAMTELLGRASKPQRPSLRETFPAEVEDLFDDLLDQSPGDADSRDADSRDNLSLETPAEPVPLDSVSLKSMPLEPEPPEPEPEESSENDEIEELPQTDWKTVEAGTPVYARFVAPDGEVELHDATFARRLKNGKVAVVLKGEEAEKFVLPKDCQLP